MIGAIFDFLRRRGLNYPHLKHAKYFSGHPSVPSDIPRSTVAIVGTPPNLKWAIFMCPCGMGHRIELNLQPMAVPRWFLQTSNSGVTLTPSVHVLSSPYCHYWVREGRVTWTKDSGSAPRR